MTRFSLTIVFLMLQGCLLSEKSVIRGKGDIALHQVDFFEIDGWYEDNHKEALGSLIHSCNKFAKMPQRRSIGGQIGNIKVSDFRDVCDIAQIVKSMNKNQSRNFFENWFRPFLVQTRFGNEKGVFTGYYEASLHGSKVKTDEYKYPIYAKPKDLTSSPYLSRVEIEEGALEGKGLEILYVKDKVDLFFMHIQGSGRAILPDGREIRVAYAGKNHQPFTAVGNYMADEGYIERHKINAASIKKWLKENPDKMDEVMNVNAAFTFFRIADGEYIVGAQGVPLTPERSLAVDKSIIPYGLPLWLDTKLKRANKSPLPYKRLVVAQDTGSAIKGTTRGDIFFGYGKEAEEKAYYMASRGRYYILLPINLVDKLK